MTRTSTRRERVPPTGRSSRSWSTRRSLAWKGPEVSLTSSRKSVPPSGRLEEARPVAVGAGEGALHVAEELALEQRVGEGGAVHGDEGLALRAGSRGGWRARSAPCRFRSRRRSARSPWRGSRRRPGRRPAASPDSRPRSRPGRERAPGGDARLEQPGRTARELLDARSQLRRGALGLGARAGSTSAAPAASSCASASGAVSARRTSSGGSRGARRSSRSVASASAALAASITSASKPSGASASAPSRLRSQTKSSVGASLARSTGISSPRLSQRIVRIGCMHVSCSPPAGGGQSKPHAGGARAARAQAGTRLAKVAPGVASRAAAERAGCRPDSSASARWRRCRRCGLRRRRVAKAPQARRAGNAGDRARAALHACCAGSRADPRRAADEVLEDGSRSVAEAGLRTGTREAARRRPRGAIRVSDQRGCAGSISGKTIAAVSAGGRSRRRAAARAARG